MRRVKSLPAILSRKRPAVTGTDPAAPLSAASARGGVPGNGAALGRLLIRFRTFRNLSSGA
jgi:hypothetical protein